MAAAMSAAAALAFALALAPAALLVGASSIIWDGRNVPAAELAGWNWATQQGRLQAYIFGDGHPLSQYITVSPAFRNPAIPAAKLGMRFVIDGTSSWHGQDMARTEVIPNLKPGWQKGVVTVHASLAMGLEQGAVPPLDPAWAHQLVFFESHFLELRYGQQPGWPAPAGGRNLQFFVNGRPVWDAAMKPGEWVNIAFTVDYDKKAVTLYSSTGGGALQKRADVASVPGVAPGSDLHIGVLRLPKGGKQLQGKTGLYYSNLWIEAGPPSGL